MSYPQTLNDWLAHLEALHPKGQAGIELGLERVQRVRALLKQIPFCPLIMVGGTNGKGSTCAYLEAIYRAAGYRVGCYTSPHLLEYVERVRVDGQSIDAASLCAAFTKVETARLAESIFLTYFEFGTLAAWEVFAAQKVDVMILEVGLGGRLDAVNSYEPDCSIITGIDLDHQDWLGTTREAIGFEKAGIMRAGKVAICADVAPPQSILDQATLLGATLRCIGRDFSVEVQDTATAQWFFHGSTGKVSAPLPLPSLAGAHQLQNAAAALAALEALSTCLPVSSPAMQSGLHDVFLPGRFQILAERPLVIVDVAHNPQAMQSLAANLRRLKTGGKTIAVLGMLADKDIAGALAQLLPELDICLLASLDVPRGASAERLYEAVQACNPSVSVHCFANPHEALTQALSLAGEDDKIIAAGSFYTAQAVLRYYGS